MNSYRARLIGQSIASLLILVGLIAALFFLVRETFFPSQPQTLRAYLKEDCGACNSIKDDLKAFNKEHDNIITIVNSTDEEYESDIEKYDIEEVPVLVAVEGDTVKESIYLAAEEDDELVLDKQELERVVDAAERSQR